MSLPLVFNPLQSALRELQIEEILQTNPAAAPYGLTLTVADAADIIEARNQVLQGYGRIELDTAVTRKIIAGFCASPYVAPEDYAATIREVQEIFYYLKNETADQLGDNELIAVLRDSFDNACGGSLELLQETAFEILAGKLRRVRLSNPWTGEGEDGR